MARTASRPEGDDLLLGDDVLEVLGGPVEGHGLDGLGCLTGVLEVNPQVGTLENCLKLLYKLFALVSP